MHGRVLRDGVWSGVLDKATGFREAARQESPRELPGGGALSPAPLAPIVPLVTTLLLCRSPLSLPSSLPPFLPLAFQYYLL